MPFCFPFAIEANKVGAEMERYSREERNRLAYSERQALDQALAQTNSPDSQELEALQDCLKMIPEHLPNLLQLRYHEESSSKEIAGRLERSLVWLDQSLR